MAFAGWVIRKAGTQQAAPATSWSGNAFAGWATTKAGTQQAASVAVLQAMPWQAGRQWCVVPSRLPQPLRGQALPLQAGWQRLAGRQCRAGRTLEKPSRLPLPLDGQACLTGWVVGKSGTQQAASATWWSGNALAGWVVGRTGTQQAASATSWSGMALQAGWQRKVDTQQAASIARWAGDAWQAGLQSVSSTQEAASATLWQATPSTAWVCQKC